jgi:hypothetical protein
VTRLLTGLARFVQHPVRDRIYLAHLAWAVFLLLACISGGSSSACSTSRRMDVRDLPVRDLLRRLVDLARRASSGPIVQHGAASVACRVTFGLRA